MAVGGGMGCLYGSHIVHGAIVWAFLVGLGVHGVNLSKIIMKMVEC